MCRSMGLRRSRAQHISSVIASAAKQSILRHALKHGLLRRFRLRSSSYGGQVAPRNDDREVGAYPSRRLRSRLHLGDGHRHQLVHLGADLRGGDRDALGGKILHHLVLDVRVAGFLEIGRDHFLGIGRGGIAGQAELFGCPKTEQLVAARLGLELLLLVEGEFLLETFLALVETGSFCGSNPRKWSSGPALSRPDRTT